MVSTTIQSLPHSTLRLSYECSQCATSASILSICQEHCL